MRSKDEAIEHYKAFEAWLGTKYGIKIKVLHSDRRGEYMSEEFDQHLAKQGTERRVTVHDTPEYNGVAERLNRTIITKVRAMLHDAQLPKFLWERQQNMRYT